VAISASKLAVRIDNGQVTERFQELMNPGQRVSGFIESYTGVTNVMLTDARPSISRPLGTLQTFTEAHHL